MSELIEDLLNLSRVTTSAMHREEINLSVFARAITEELCHESPSRKVDFVTPEHAEAYGDARLLRIVMDNLLRNAWKYTSHHNHARIEFGQEMKNERLIYFVKDDGSGFDPRAADRLFQPFHRLHAATEFPGDGIGLATVRRIVERHGGEAWAEGAVEKRRYLLLHPRIPKPHPVVCIVRPVTSQWFEYLCLLALLFTSPEEQELCEQSHSSCYWHFL